MRLPCVHMPAPHHADPTFVGCFHDMDECLGHGGGTHGGGAVGFTYLNASADMTVPLCKEAASNAGYSYALVESDQICYGGNDASKRAESVEPVLCDTPCAGDQSQVCGGSCEGAIYVGE